MSIPPHLTGNIKAQMISDLYFNPIYSIMKREAFKIFLKPRCEAEYEKRHREICPELKKLLSDNGVYDYSIYWDKETNILFACQKTKGGESSQDMGSNPIVQKWWDYMADIMKTNPDNSPVSIPLYEIFRME
jgi:L-rhamnose mutarotase